jgi:prevent-host-death family protein
VWGIEWFDSQLNLSRLSRWRWAMRGHWQLQEAKQRFSELIRSVETEGPQVVTRHGEEVAVVVDIAEYRRLCGAGSDFKRFLRSGPDFDLLEIDRSEVPARIVDLGEGE